MNMDNFFLPLTMVVVCYSFSKTHVMNNLIMIEFIAMLAIMVLFLMIKMMTLENHLVLYFIILMITESIIGLSLMISMIRTHGNDFLKSSVIVKF